MVVFAIARFEVRPETRDAAERALHEHASFVRRELPAVSWTVYRDPAAPTRYTAMARAEDSASDERHRRALSAALAPHLAGDIEVTGAELVTSSDLQRRHRRERGRRPRSRLHGRHSSALDSVRQR